MKSTIHPYRKTHRAGEYATGALGEELILYVALCVVGAIPVASGLSRGGAFGVEPTLGLVMMIAGITGVLAALVGGWRGPRDPDAR